MSASPASASVDQGNVSPIITTSSGKVQGVLRNNALEFRGIPYGESTAGQSRWTLPKPAKPWSGVLQAKDFGPACAQAVRYGMTEASDHEDCLYLNISMPASGSQVKQQPLPVIIWIHGGAFVGGSSSLYRLDWLAEKARAVVVSINYRLGVLGFMPHPAFDQQHNGGYALEDQRLAMRWVKQNIAAFGGDPNNITLAGESAGASSVCMHLITPEQTEGLFHKAIIQSAACTFALREASAWNTFGTEVAQQAGCTDASKALACMRSKDVQTLIAAAAQVAGEDAMAFAPVYGTQTVPRQALESLMSGKFVRVPVMNGNTRDEMRLYVAYDVQAGKQYTAANYSQTLEAIYAEHASEVEKRYPLANYSSAPAALGSVMSDFRPDLGINHCQSLDTSLILSGETTVFHSDFADRSAPVLGVSVPVEPDPGFELGAVHSAELNYYFPNFSNTSKIDGPSLPDESQALSNQMIETWANFIRTGRPSAKNLPAWDQFDATRKTMRLEPGKNRLIDAEKLYQCDFWRSLYPEHFSAN
ncbi:MAG: carboxylesterase family protein [Burkholderiaceae bacterium]|nr:carboxylesterase family protein [Burkholderiaceae bacterium]